MLFDSKARRQQSCGIFTKWRYLTTYIYLILFVFLHPTFQNDS